MAINVRAPLLLIKARRCRILKQSQGCVLNIGSINGYCGEANQLAYSISKGALITLSRNLADALGREKRAGEPLQRRLGADAERVQAEDRRGPAARLA